MNSHDMSIKTLYKATDATTTDPGALGWYQSTSPFRGFCGEESNRPSSTGSITTPKIYVNGTQVGNQQYGYVSFYCDLTPYLNRCR